MSSICLEQDDAGIVHLIFDKPNSKVNLLDRVFIDDYIVTINKLKDMQFAGVILRSAKLSFFAGADITALSACAEQSVEDTYLLLSSLKAAMRWLETCGKPVVACINGAALGSGWELALGCHHRIALSKKVVLGLPEVTLGLMPGVGGVVKMTLLMGVEAVVPYLLKGKLFDCQEGLALGLIDQIAASNVQMMAQATNWILSQSLPVRQCFDNKGYQLPDGDVSDPHMVVVIATAPAILKKKTQGNQPAPEAILSVMIESTDVDIDTALRIETRYFIHVIRSQVAKNMMNTFWHQHNEIKAGASRPKEPALTTFSKIGVLGAGMMGAGIAYALASHGITVILKDISLEKAVFAKSYTASILANCKLTNDEKGAILNRIIPSKDPIDLIGCEMVIEAVFEDRKIKSQATIEILQVVGDDIIMASNTSTLPITSLASSSTKPENFIGLHFFSPVDKMPLVEIIKGDKTSSATLAAAYDLVLQIGKVPIIVNDSRGFFTSRVFFTYVSEGMRMLSEGIPGEVIENAAIQAGLPVGPLAIIDEVSLSLIDNVRNQARIDLKAEGKTQFDNPADGVLDQLLALKRLGKSAGAGFYDYSGRGQKRLWSGLVNLFPTTDDWDINTVKDRLLFVQSLEALRAYEEGVVTSSRDANIGSIMGLGFPAWTGGVLQFVDHYGADNFKQRAEQLCEQFGPQFTPVAILSAW
ncbi:Enoyl-CoA hydratase [isoleucine degradation] / 3-hydroxyacyl-CoA dehydrogenase/ 3-hydroxybutyryl-CoA epimerase [Moritella sp. JT01]|uniref:3-hydroxyacyl-CoA dehydrogenase NAD-binding domain-containing protein n=1 Tax=Moritella sp. JT01 TaxID=756698 RepID=UPI0007979967|nr:3-hydroxyacyl-CoA dehydrogenase NAD-binding domain-containing protein [Moritella sp. JT01]KXO06987.1 Enoyl-CoA hydratase [isoleucine degradation] / 3-hydroxyacyl-CoA dehydrogenase/ 3-hydroxybutyryl-CoA epimerase [Moritella sp. JT01]